MSGSELLSQKYWSASQSLHKKGKKLISSHSDPEFLRQLPPSQQSLRPALVQIMVSPLKGHAVKVLVSSGVQQNPGAEKLVQALVDCVSHLQHANLLASEGCAEAGEAIQPDEAAAEEGPDGISRTTEGYSKAGIPVDAEGYGLKG